MGFNANDFVKTLSLVPGIKSLDLYMGGYSSSYLPDGTQITAGVKTYQQLSSIPGYGDNVNSFPAVNSDYDVVFQVTNPINAYEIIVLDTLTVNVLT